MATKPTAKGRVAEPRFSRATMRFLGDLEKHNNRPWFQAHREAYERDVRDASVAFVRDMLPYVAKLSPHYTGEAKPVGGSIMRIHRDTRFTKDKSPYKAAAGIHFWHEDATEAKPAPVFYLHMGPKHVYVGGGLYMLSPAGATRVRNAIATEPEEWVRAKRPVKLDGEQLKRVPKPWTEDHPLAADLRRKQFLWWLPLKRSDVGPRLQDKCLAGFEKGAPMMGFLCGALGFRY